ncbi:hypothetical protein EJB05_23562, partial [Eragrostis curvula]
MCMHDAAGSSWRVLYEEHQVQPVAVLGLRQLRGRVHGGGQRVLRRQVPRPLPELLLHHAVLCEGSRAGLIHRPL